jgi:ribosomal-protein-alanine N-acetyltransferase
MNLVIHSERLTLTPFSAADVDLAIETFTDPDVRKYAGGVIAEDEIRRCMSNWIKRGGNGCIGIWCVSDRSSAEKFGSTALLPMPVEEQDTDYSLVISGQIPDADIEIGCFLKRSAWGKGYATEACKRLIRLAFEASHLTEVVATFDVGNIASRNVLKKAGFLDRGITRCYGKDGLNYRITRDEWLGLQQSA